MSQQLTAGALINRHFFFIDSTDETLNDVRTHLYGYFIDGGKVFDGKLDEDFSFDENKFYSGSYIFVRKSIDRIELIQDYVGSYGLFLFRHGDYFALSNSFVMLVDRIKTKFPLTLNEDYANASLLHDTTTFLSFTETLIKEIEILPRCCRVFIDLSTKRLDLVPITYGEYTVPLDSVEGIRLIDDWARKWIGIINNLVDNNKFVMTNLTGGFDSRITFMLFLISGIDLNRINVTCYNALYGPYEERERGREDFEIASAIAKTYGFSINRADNLPPSRHFTVDEMINIFFHAKLGFHEIMFGLGEDTCRLEPVYCFNGFGGETLKRNMRDVTPAEYIQSKLGRARTYKTVDFRASVARLLSDEFKRIAGSPSFIESKLPLTAMQLYHETRNRNHFGRSMVENYCANSLSMSPLLDREPCRVRTFERCSDPMLLYIFLLVRFQKELLSFKVQGGRSYNPETIKLAEELNAKYPLEPTLVRPRKISRDLKLPIFSLTETPKPDAPSRKAAEEKLLALFRTEKFKQTFTDRFSEEIYARAQHFAVRAEHNVNRLFDVNPIIAVTKVLTDINISRYMSSGSFDQYFDVDAGAERRLEARSKKLSLLLDLFRTARIELIKDNAPSASDFLLAPSDPNCIVYNFVGLDKNQSGRMIESSSGSLGLKLRCTTDGTLTLILKVKELIDRNGANLPLQLDFTRLTFNGRALIADKRVTARFDNPIGIKLSLTRGELYELELEWQVHGCDNAEFKKLFNAVLDDGLIY